MKPSKTIIILASIAAILGGGTYALLLSQQEKAETVGQVSSTPTPTAEETATPAVADESSSPTATPTISTDLAAETSIFEKEFSAVSEDDFADSSLDDASLGL